MRRAGHFAAHPLIVCSGHRGGTPWPRTQSRPTSDRAAPPLPPIAAKAKDLEALRSAVVDAANVGAGLWFSYLFVLLYLVIAVGSVTHRNLSA